MIAVGITTAPRPRETLASSLRSLREAGYEDTVYVFDDGGANIADDGVALLRNDPPRGGLRNWQFSLETMLALEPDAEWLLILEDDVTWARGAWAKLTRETGVFNSGHRVGYASLYLSRRVSSEIEKRKGRLGRGWHSAALPAKCYWGSLAYMLPRDAAIELVQDHAFRTFCAHSVKNRNRDGVISEHLLRLGRNLYYRVPCMVNHTLGDGNSALGKTKILRNQTTDYWTGEA